MLREACAKPDLELPRHTLRHLSNVLRTCPAKAGLGVDLWVLRLFAALPIEGLKVLQSSVHLVQQGIIPMQLLVVLIGLMPKESGGERPIALTAMLYRLVMKLNKSNMTPWDADKAEFWDTALKGSSCLRAALCRALKVEVATAQGFASVGLLWDLAALTPSGCQS